MKKLFGSCIVVGPVSSGIFRFRYTPTAIAILALAWVASFSMVVVLGYHFPPLVTDRDQIRLEIENQELRVRNRNTEIGTAKIDRRLSRLEGQAQRIGHLLEAE